MSDFDRRKAFYGSRSRADSNGSTRRAFVPLSGQYQQQQQEQQPNAPTPVKPPHRHRRRHPPSVPKPSSLAVDRGLSLDSIQREIPSLPQDDGGHRRADHHSAVVGKNREKKNLLRYSQSVLTDYTTSLTRGEDFLDSYSGDLDFDFPINNNPSSDIESGGVEVRVAATSETQRLLDSSVPSYSTRKKEIDIFSQLANQDVRQEINAFSQLANADIQSPPKQPPLKHDSDLSSSDGTNTITNKPSQDDDNHDDESHHTAYKFWNVYSTIFKANFYDEESPEFTTRQQHAWAVIIGILMGLFTALWNELIESAVELMWVTVPEHLLEWGVFTQVDGPRPLAHYMWICPAVFGGVLSYISAALPTPIPGQNEWIDSLHRRGLMDHSTAPHIFLISTAGMMSGLSLGPELPLILIAGMAGSYLGLITQQSMLSARVLNLTAASAAIGGFFGFPMAGALFVLEVPHQMGLQYFEALNPAVIASIVAVIFNRIATRDEVAGKFSYPPLRDVLPSHIFYIALIYGLVGCAAGVFYVRGCLYLKNKVHDWFHSHDDDHDDGLQLTESEDLPLHGTRMDGLLKNKDKNVFGRFALFFQKAPTFVIKQEPKRAAAAGVVAGALVGIISIFLPHNLFWGEAQLQSLLDSGKTHLPVFGESTSGLIHYGYCLPESLGEDGFSLSCSILLVLSKVLVIGLSLGTGIVGGHFWGPLYVGAATANIYTSAMTLLSTTISEHFGETAVLSLLAKNLAMYPTLALICVMGSCHVVTFKANMAIMLILILTIREFAGSGNAVSDYSAVFPLLVVSTFTSLMFTRGTTFYKKQGNRGDLIVSDPTLSQPGKFGYVTHHDHNSDDSSSYSSGSELDSDIEDEAPNVPFTLPEIEPTTQDEIDKQFMHTQSKIGVGNIADPLQSLLDDPYRASSPTMSDYSNTGLISRESFDSGPNSVAKNSFPPKHQRILSGTGSDKNLAKSVKGGGHRRSHSDGPSSFTGYQPGGRPRSNSVVKSSRNRIPSFGEITDKDYHPSLLDQARRRASTTNTPTHSRARSGSGSSLVGLMSSENAGGLSSDMVERAFSAKDMQDRLGIP